MSTLTIKKQRLLWHASLTTIAPALGLIVGFMQCMQGRVSGYEIWLAVGMFYLTGVGVEVGLHRLFSHRAFDGHPVLVGGLAILGSMAAQGPLIDWAVSHRTHHRFSDKTGDLHSPHCWQNRSGKSGFWHAHLGWLFRHETGNYFKIAPDLFQNKTLMWINRHYVFWIFLGFLIPGIAGFCVEGLHGLWQGMLWGGLIRIFFLQHATFLTNSLCHLWGRRDFQTDDRSRNIPALFLFSIGSSMHNTHHAFPSSAKTALIAGHIDLGWLLIVTWKKLGLVSRINEPEKNEIASRLLALAVPRRLEGKKP